MRKAANALATAILSPRLMSVAENLGVSPEQTVDLALDALLSALGPSPSAPHQGTGGSESPFRFTLPESFAGLMPAMVRASQVPEQVLLDAIFEALYQESRRTGTRHLVEVARPHFRAWARNRDRV